MPSEGKYPGLLDSRIKEHVIKAITGDVEKTLDSMVSDWYNDGGIQLTKEANDWYASIK